MNLALLKKIYRWTRKKKMMAIYLNRFGHVKSERLTHSRNKSLHMRSAATCVCLCGKSGKQKKIWLLMFHCTVYHPPCHSDRLGVQRTAIIPPGLMLLININIVLFSHTGYPLSITANGNNIFLTQPTHPQK
jgi:hypothetical protein